MYSKKKWNLLPPEEVLKRKTIYIQRNTVARSHTIYISPATMTPLCLNMFLSVALNGYLNSRDKTDNCMCVRCVYHLTHHHVSIAVATMIRLAYKNDSYLNSLSKRISELVDVTKNVSNLPHSQCVSAIILLYPTKSSYLKAQISECIFHHYIVHFDSLSFITQTHTLSHKIMY
jgi:hypothetical protein